MNTRRLEANELNKILNLKEDHFNDVKSKRINPAKLQETFVSFANTDGGELFIGVEDAKVSGDRVIGFKDPEEANDILHVLLEETEPGVENVEVEFIDCKDKGYILHISIPKSPKVHYTSQKKCYIRVNARKKEIKGDRILALSYSKGAYSYEKQPVEHVEIDDVIHSPYFNDYLRRVESSLEPNLFLKKQRLISKKNGEQYPNVGCILLFDEEPQASLDTRCAIKIYRLRTTTSEYRREQLESLPITINGPLEKQINDTLEKIDEILSNATYNVSGRLEKLQYPVEAIKEILVNAVIHRDYSINDDIHVKIYDNRIEIFSPGRLPGFMTVDNIYDERYSRNPNIVRLLHNLPNPPNHDIGEGLNTARNELRKVGLVEPVIEEKENGLLVTIKHQKLAVLEDIIVEYLKKHPGSYITNKDVRNLSGENDVNKVKKAFQKLRSQGVIVPIDKDASAFNFKYKLARDK